MAVLHYKKLDFYSKSQALRDEAGAPAHLESAGDVLIKDLVRKQTRTVITLEEQLEVSQEFERGSDLKPWNASGVTSLEDFRNRIVEIDVKPERNFLKEPDVECDLEKITSKTGLSRHELELGLVEKPESKTSKLYRFALQNQRRAKKKEDLISKLADHPLNHLKEIEKEAFGHVENSAGCEESTETGVGMKMPARRRKRRRAKRKRDMDLAKSDKSCRSGGASTEEMPAEENEPSTMQFRQPSLWDVKDMKKFCKNEQQGCQMQKLYTIIDGQIVEFKNEDCDDSIVKFGG